jgi:iron complex outermembrane receptor protein
MSSNPSFVDLTKKIATAGAVCGLPLLLSSGQVSAQEGQGVGAGGALEEIVVTSRRRAESLLDMPFSISAMTADQMEAQGILTVEDMSDFVPNLTMQSSNRANQNRVVIRGIGGGHPDPVFVFGSGMYVDGHYIPNSLGGFMSTLDIERVEVLRGPQGTLFGKNVMGGAVNIISTKPQEEFDSSVRIRAGEDGEFNIRGMLNVPFSDTLFGRFSVSSEQFDGYYFNQNLQKDAGFRDTKAGRAALRWMPNDQLTVDGALSLVRKRDDNLGGQCIGQGSLGDAPQWGGGAGNLERRLFAGATQALFDICAQDVAAGDYVFSSDRATFSNVDEVGASLGLDYDMGTFGSFDSSSISLKGSYRNMEYTYLADRDYTSLPIDHIGTIGPKGQHNETLGFEALFEAEVNDRFRFTVGYNYFQENALNGNDKCHLEARAAGGLGNAGLSQTCSDFGGLAFELVPDNPTGTGQWPNGPRRNPFGPGPFGAEISVYNKSHGVFGHATYDINEKWTLDVGARYTSDNREFRNIEIAVSDCLLPLAPTSPLCGGDPTFLMTQAGLADGFFNSAEDTFTAFTPMASLTYNMNPTDSMDSGLIYATVSEGFLTGGFNTEVNSNLAGVGDFLTYDPEEVTNYELGFKGSFGGGRVQIMADVFFMDYKNLQRQVVIPNDNGLFGADADVGLVQNAATASISGVEFELRASPWEGGYVTADFSYLKNEYDNYSYPDPTNPGQIVDLTQTRIQDLTPSKTINLSVEHQFQLSNGGTITPRLAAYWQSEFSFGLNNLGIDRNDDTKSSCTQDAYTKLNGRVTYRPPAGDWNLALTGGNLTDERIIDTCDTNRSVWRLRYERPRFLGLEFSMHFGRS